MLFLAKMRGANLTIPYKNDGVTDRSISWYFSLDLPCSYTWKFLTFSVVPALLINSGNIGFEFNLGLTYKMQGKTYL
jgi:hypothetical protein